MDAPGKAFLGDVLVLGLGTTGADVARYCAALMPERVRSLTVVGGEKSTWSEAAEELTRLGATVVVGASEAPGTFDLAIASPGISEFSPFFGWAKSASREIIGEPEFAWRESPERWIAITGTNGKTTTTALTAAILNEAGLKAYAVGNIGTSAISCVATREPGSWFVAELSSFQLATTEKFHPHVACLLNITPDHVEWHKTHQNYVAAKERIFKNLGSDDLAIYVEDACNDSKVIQDFMDRKDLQSCPVCLGSWPSAHDCARIDDQDSLVVELSGQTYVLPKVEELKLVGAHNMANALTAATAALFVGAPVESVANTLKHFGALEHRIEPAGEVSGVRYINDSKATNTDSVIKALSSFEPGRVICLVGGHDKGGDLTAFGLAMAATAKAAVAYGEAQGRLGAALEEAGVRVLYAPHMAEALSCAAALAVPGDVVLLSPACSSYDEFNNFEERGRIFKELVAKMQVEAEADGDAPDAPASEAAAQERA